MGMRIRLARFLLRLGGFIQSLPVLVMKADDLVEFSRQAYARPQNVEAWAEDPLVDSGLSADELDLLAAVPARTGELLLLGVGGGREAIPLARMGFRVTGVDYVTAMVQRAEENAARRGVQIEGLVQEISQLDVQEDAYDVVWLSRNMYSCVPTRARRVAMVRRITRALKPGGLFLCQFQWRASPRPRGKGELLRRAVAACTLGNLAYEVGDTLWLNVEFVHEFSSEDAIRSELEEGGLEVLCIQTSRTTVRGSAVCKKAPESGPNAVI
jgi:2-polyprenyl-3-methyl-5-hydroxy-6-metoxy-1,4-benzoquinol methylase